MTENQTIDVSRPPMMRNAYIAVAVLALGTVLLLTLPIPAWGYSIEDYVIIHVLFETIAIAVCAMVFAVGWRTYNKTPSSNIVILACGFLGVSLLDFTHMLSFPSMPTFITPSSLEKAIDFWLAARVLAAGVLAVALLAPTQASVKNVTRYVLLGAILVITAVVHWVFLFHPDLVPESFVPGSGLTAFKIGSEFFIITLNIFAAFTVWRNRHIPQTYNAKILFVALSAMALSEMLFASFRNETDIYNFFGHVLKLIGYLCLYRAVFIETIERPYQLLDAAKSNAQANELMLRSTMNALSANICVLDEAGTIEAVNNDWLAFAIFNGADPKQVGVGRNYFQICAVANGEERSTASAMADGIRDVAFGMRDSFNIEYPCHSPEAQRWYAASVRRFQLNNQVRIVVAHVDITKRKQAEMALRASEERMRLMTQNVKDYAIVMLDLQARVISWNEGAHELMGYAALEIIGQSVERLYTSEDIEVGSMMALLEEAQHSGRAEKILWRVRKDGTRFIADVVLTAVNDNTGQLLGFVSITRDITERKNAEDEIRKLNEDLEVRIIERTRDLKVANAHLMEREEEIRAVLDNIKDCVITFDAQGVVLSANPATEVVLGYTVAEFVGQNIAITIPAKYKSEHHDYLDRYMRMSKLSLIGVGREVKAQKKNGQLVFLDLSLSDYLVRGERFYVVILRDFSERKRLLAQVTRAREEAEQANQAKSTFLATMSHEIRTPMNGVTGMLELLSLTPLDSSQRTTLKVVRDSSKTLMRIIDDILDFSKIEAHKLSIYPEATRIGNLLEDVRSTYASKASSKGLLIYCRVDEKISPALMLDSVRLGQILNNLVSNAIKFTSSGHINITADLIDRSESEERVRFCVIDTGIGIAKEQQDRLFQPFVQAEFNTTRRYGGTGLGLAITSRLVDLMGGSIDIVSEPGKGCTVVVELLMPIADPALLADSDALINNQDLPLPSTDSIKAVPNVAQAEAEGTLVLLVDDHPINRMLLTRQLNLLGYAAESAENGVQALQMWKTGRYRLVLTDCNMPEMDGYDLARSIRKLEANSTAKRCPIIACTANVLGEEAAICLEAGMDDYIAKPVDLKRLLRKLELWLPLPANPTLALAENRADAMLATSPLDHTILTDITSGDTAIESKLFIVFKRANDEDAQRLAQAVTDRDSAQVKRLAHMIKGASAMIGATDLSTICERIELANQRGDWSTVLACLTKFQQEVVKLNSYFAEFADRTTVT